MCVCVCVQRLATAEAFLAGSEDFAGRRERSVVYWFFQLEQGKIPGDCDTGATVRAYWTHRERTKTRAELVGQSLGLQTRLDSRMTLVFQAILLAKLTLFKKFSCS